MRFFLFRWMTVLRASFWFIPSMLTISGLALALWCLRIDAQQGSKSLEPLFGNFLHDPSGCRSILSTIAASVITVCGTVFSITIVVLTMASSQFGPRLIPNFMRKNATQVVMGTFIGTFVYALVVLSAVRGDDYEIFVPQISVATGLLLGITCFLGLIYFIHHVATFIQVPRVLDDIQHDLHRVFEREFPLGEAPTTRGRPDEEDVVLPATFEHDAREVKAGRSGYVQVIDHVELVRLAARHDVTLALAFRAGRFVVRGDVVARIRPRASAGDELVDEVAGCFALGAQRTTPHDVEFGIDQIVEVAVRALSPGINDPFTAINCLDRLGASLADLAARPLRSRFLRDEGGTIRVLEPVPTYVGAVDAAFHQIRQNGKGHAAVAIRMLEVFAGLGRRELPGPMRARIREHAAMVRDDSVAAQLNAKDVADIEARHALAQEALAS